LGKDPTTEKRAEAEGVPEWGERKRLPEKLSSLRRKLHQKAKQEPKFRFYALYDRIYRQDVLKAAWKQVKANDGSPGVDGVTIDQIVNSGGGPAQFIDEIQQALRAKTYQPQAILRAYIEKPDGRLRPLGIPTVRDRVVQMAALLILEPIFEADFEECSYGFRPGRRAHQALDAIQEHIKSGFTQIYDADLKSYFDTISHEKLMKVLEYRIADRSVLKLIRMWLRAPVVEKDEDGRPGTRRSRQGTPQGGVISPLLANAFLHWFDKIFHMRTGPRYWANARLVRYADDFVVMARYQGEQLRQFVEGFIEGRMGLSINREKTRVVNLEKGESLDFLGFTFQYHRDLQGRGHRYLHVMPSKKALARERAKLLEMTHSSLCFKPIPALIRDLNRHIRGWANYFNYGHPRRCFRQVNWVARKRLAVHLRRRSQRRFRPPKGVSFYRHLANLGLVYL
jgi:RNA-directed DNA polymerase